MRILLSASDKAELKGFSDDYLKVVTGVGPIAAASLSMKAALEFKADAIVSIGSAGAISDSLEIGKAYSFGTVLTPDQNLTKFHLSLGSTLSQNRATIRELRSADCSSSLVLYSSGTFSSSVLEAHKALLADASDMESYGVAMTAHNLNIPFYAIKLITDRVGESAKVGDVSFKLREGRAELIALVESLVR